MTNSHLPAGQPSLVEQRRQLRLRLHAQRQYVARLLMPTPDHAHYQPRSKTMRLLTQQPVVTAGLLAVLASVFLGVRLMRSVPMALAFARMLNAAADRSARNRAETITKYIDTDIDTNSDDTANTKDALFAL